MDPIMPGNIIKHYKICDEKEKKKKGRKKMIQHIYSIKDKKDGFGACVPFISEVSTADELAIRYFESHLKRTPIMNDNMEDFEICEIGTFDTISGTFIADPSIHPKTIAKGADYIGNKNFTI